MRAALHRYFILLYTHTHTHIHLYHDIVYTYIFHVVRTHTHCKVVLLCNMYTAYIYSTIYIYSIFSTLSRYSSVLAKATSPERQTIWSERVVAVVEYPSERNPTYKRTALPTHHNLTSVTHERLRNIYVYVITYTAQHFFYIGLR